MATLKAAAQHALERGLEYLCAMQDEPACWTDFYLPTGTSDAWVTAFAGLSLVERYQEHAHRGAAWLLSNSKASGGWGYNSSVAADADSTAFAVLLLSRLGMAVPPVALDFLWRHYRLGGGFCTYDFDDPEHQWTNPCADVTASALAALHAAAQVSQAQLRTHFEDLLRPRQQPDGSWSGYWWNESNYPSALVLNVWDAAGQPETMYPPSPSAVSTNFEAASALLIATYLKDAAAAAAYTADLLAAQHSDGAWPGDAQLKVPPSHPQRNPYQRTLVIQDRRRIFTTAQVTRSLERALPLLASTSIARIPCRTTSAPIPNLPIEELYPGAAKLFRCLTQDMFDGRTKWPAPQLSALSGGVPVEFSASTSSPELPELRYTVDPGEVHGPPRRRVESALEVARNATEYLGYSAAWDRLDKSIRLLADHAGKAPASKRFFVWIGADHNDTRPTVLKLYFRLFGSPNLLEITEAAELPVSGESRRIFALLNQAGFAQEVGFGLGPDGRVGIKIYWELSGWSRLLVDRILSASGFEATADALCPDIPLLLRESLAAKSRAGISLRLDSRTGDIAEVTTSAEFIQHMLPAHVTAHRVDRWIASNGWTPNHHRRLFNALSQKGDPTHTLFTRTVARNGNSRATIYLRPSAAIFTPGQQGGDTNTENLAHQSINRIKERSYS